VTLAAWLARADALCREGKYFEAHEELEAGWMAAEGLEKTVLQGLIQVAAGLYRLQRSPDKTDGAFYLFERGILKLHKGKTLLAPGGVERLEDQLGRMRTARKAPATFEVGLAPL
jgi:hypothetical protein